MQKSTTIIGILEMFEDGYSYRDVQARFAVGNSTITDIKKKFAVMDIPLKELMTKSPKVIESMFYANQHPGKNLPLPDFSQIYTKLTDKKSRSNLYFIWLDYKKVHPDGYQYTQFKHYFKKWLDENHLEENLRMAVERIPGEIIYIDWIGDTLDLILTETNGVLQTAHFFVTTIGVSSYCFAMAFPDEKAESFLQGTIEALHFYKRAPKILRPDNTKAASIKNTKDALILNKVYEDLQDYYGVVIVPAPPRKPRGKASVENHVRWLETHLLEKLRGRWFDSFTSLNNEILSIIDELNMRPFQNGKGNRKELFDRYDKPAMKSLPNESLKSYTYEIKKVPNNYHIMYDGHYYSVPYTYYKQEVTLKASYFDIVICDSMNHLICKHERLYKPYPKYSTIKEHMPPNHQYYSIENHFDSSSYRQWAKTYGENIVQLINKVISSFNYEEQSYKSCNGILHLCKEYPKAISNKAAENCINRNKLAIVTLKKNFRILQAIQKQETKPTSFQSIRIYEVKIIMNKLNSNHERKDEEMFYNELYEKLKAMKFSGMAEELRKQLEDPNSESKGFEERFADLVSAEWNLRYNKKFQRYLKKSGLKIPGASFDDKLYDPSRELNTLLIEQLNTCDWIDTGKNLLITGMTGTGKSYYANALGVVALKQFKTVRYVKASKLLTELEAYHQMEDSVKLLSVIEQLSKVDMLIIDDFGLMELDIEKCRDIFEILDGREGRKSTVVISQLPVKEWYDLFKDSTYADACLDRLLYKAYRLEFKGDSLRETNK